MLLGLFRFGEAVSQIAFFHPSFGFDKVAFSSLFQTLFFAKAWLEVQLVSWSARNVLHIPQGVARGRFYNIASAC